MAFSKIRTFLSSIIGYGYHFHKSLAFYLFDIPIISLSLSFLAILYTPFNYLSLKYQVSSIPLRLLTLRDFCFSLLWALLSYSASLNWTTPVYHMQRSIFLRLRPFFVCTCTFDSCRFLRQGASSTFRHDCKIWIDLKIKSIFNLLLNAFQRSRRLAGVV